MAANVEEEAPIRRGLKRIIQIPLEAVLTRISHMDHKFCRTECRFLV